MFRSVVAALCALLSLPAIATADEARFRVGVIAGEPLGGSIFLGLADQLAIHAAVGQSLSERRQLSMSADLVLRISDPRVEVGDGFLIAWFGAGARVSSLVRSSDTFVPGLRVPVGVSYLILDGASELFFELTPGLEFDSARRVSLEGGVGMRVGF